MERRQRLRSGIRAMRVVLPVVCLAITGCVINPYIKSPTHRTAGQANQECDFLTTDSAVEEVSGNVATDGRNVVPLERAMLYATCTQRAMERKAGKYAWMNNGGALLLIHMAGLAGYSGSRGGHTAQVTSMTTGGATFYGAQQYLYKKPREAIYWMGSEATSCAIAVTSRRLVSMPEKAAALSDFHRDHIAEPLERLRDSARNEAVLRSRLQAKIPAKCSDQQDEALRVASNEAMTRTISALGNVSIETLGRDSARFGMFLVEHRNASEMAKSDLIDTTNAIRTAVNRQIASQQPGPAELAKLLGTLKLPALAGSSAAPAVVPDANSAKNMTVPKTARTWQVAAKQAPSCTSVRPLMLDYLQTSTELHRLHGELVQARVDFLAMHAFLEEGEKQKRPIEQCLHLRGSSLGPFRLVLAQAGAIELKEGETTTIPIEGGVPPFRIEPLDDGDKVKANAKPSALGGYEIEVKAVGKATAKGRFFASDSSGGSAVFTVVIK